MQAKNNYAKKGANFFSQRMYIEGKLFVLKQFARLYYVLLNQISSFNYFVFVVETFTFKRNTFHVRMTIYLIAMTL